MHLEQDQVRELPAADFMSLWTTILHGVPERNRTVHRDTRVRLRLNPIQTVQQPVSTFFHCGLNNSLVTVETRWAVACTFAVISDPKVAVLTAPMKVQCVGEYLEVGSVGHPLCTPGVDC